MTRGAELARAVEALVGRPFRLHGRSPETGLDCIGLIAAGLDAIGVRAAFPSGYSIRTRDFPALARIAAGHGFQTADGESKPGDVHFVRSGPGQLHAIIAATRRDTFVEAHAGIGRVILRPGPITEPILQRWRLATPSRG